LRVLTLLMAEKKRKGPFHAFRMYQKKLSRMQRDRQKADEPTIKRAAGERGEPSI